MLKMKFNFNMTTDF